VGFPNCVVDSGVQLGTFNTRIGRVRYPVGRYHYVDHQVKNGFTYFYSVTAFDSTGFGQGKVELNGRRAAVEAEGVAPQSASNVKSKVWVVPNPYRDHAPWDRPPVPGDAFARHIDFMGLPAARSVIRIYTLAGDLVQTLDHDGRHGDGQARWDLISRNGQDVASGVYLFTVESGGTHQVGRFVLLR